MPETVLRVEERFLKPPPERGLRHACVAVTALSYLHTHSQFVEDSLTVYAECGGFFSRVLSPLDGRCTIGLAVEGDYLVITPPVGPRVLSRHGGDPEHTLFPGGKSLTSRANSHLDEISGGDEISRV